MIFAGLVFIFLFLPFFIAVYFIHPARSWRNVVLLMFSLLFYAWGEPTYVFLMLASILVNYLFALVIDKPGTNRKAVLAAAIAFNLVLLGVFKYADFIIANINYIFKLSIPYTGLPLPIGISFYTFQILSYVIDVYRGSVKVQRNPIYLGAYVTAFPQLIAGPIVRYQTIEYELENRKETVEGFIAGIRRFIIGLGKKVIIANNAAFVADALLKESPDRYGMAGAWMILVAYALQIYFDFSGYSDMAIGMGRMLGFNFPENFNYPYIAKSITDFWRRWHISLSSFFRDYVYIPMGGNRVSRLRWIFNIAVVWFLTGLWHGASWNYVLWGLYYAALLVLEKLLLGQWLKKLPSFLAHIYTVFFFMLGWALFRIESLPELKNFFIALAGFKGGGYLSVFVYSQVLQAHYIIVLILGIIFCTPVSRSIREKAYRSFWTGTASDLLLIVILLVSVSLLVSSTYNPFIYFRF